jgi:hypothetical protein
MRRTCIHGRLYNTSNKGGDSNPCLDTEAVVAGRRLLCLSCCWLTLQNRTSFGSSWIVVACNVCK